MCKTRSFSRTRPGPCHMDVLMWSAAHATRTIARYSKSCSTSVWTGAPKTRIVRVDGSRHAPQRGVHVLGCRIRLFPPPQLRPPALCSLSISPALRNATSVNVFTTLSSSDGVVANNQVSSAQHPWRCHGGKLVKLVGERLAKIYIGPRLAAHANAAVAETCSMSNSIGLSPPVKRSHSTSLRYMRAIGCNCRTRQPRCFCKQTPSPLILSRDPDAEGIARAASTFASERH